MINNTVFNIALGHATGLEAATGKKITPTKISALSNLVGLSYVGDLPEQTEITYADVLQATTQDSIEGPSLHTQAIADEIDRLAPLVSNHISFIQNTVCPKVHDFETRMNDVAKAVSSVDPFAGFEVIQVSAPDPTTNEDFMSLVNSYADSNMGPPSMATVFPSLSIDDIIKAMEVSSSNVNASIRRWIAERGDAWLKGIWDYYFSGGNSGLPSLISYAAGYAGIASQPPYQRLDTGLALFLISRGLMDEPIEGAGIDLSTWRTQMDHISRFAGYQVQAAMRQIDIANSQEMLVLGVFDNARRITVNSPIYTRYLEEGGKVEDVIGAALSGRNSSYSLATFREHGKEFNGIFSNFRAMSQSSLQAKAVTRLREEAKAIFAVTLDCITEDEANALASLNRTRESMIQEANTAIDSKVLPQLTNTNHLAIEIIAGIRFSHTPARQFLLDMKAAEESGCTCAEEAAGIAALNYLCAYQASNLGLTN